MPATSYQYLTRIPGVRSGHTIVEGTRIGVHDVMALIVTGASVDDVCRSFPELKRSQVYACLAYRLGPGWAETWRGDYRLALPW